jgi:hypothetical protein
MFVSLLLTINLLKVKNPCHQYKTRPAYTSVHDDQDLILLVDQNGNWTRRFKKFSWLMG